MIEELKIKIETYYAIQKIRIQAELRIKAFIRDDRLTELQAQSLHFWEDEHLKGIEKSIKKDVTLLLKDVPIYTEWMKDVLGIGPCLAGSLYAGIYDISRFNTISKLWKYCGQDVDESGRAPRRQKGKKLTADPFLQMTIYKLTDSFVKQTAEKCLYRRLYDIKKAFYKQEHPEKVDSGRRSKKGEVIWDYTDLHIHRMAKRYAGKIFLEHLWVEWRTLEGLPVSKPWVIEHGGHGNYIEPTCI